MRSLILFLLLAGTTGAALAQERGPFGMRLPNRAAQSTDDGGERARPQRAERSRPSLGDGGRVDDARPQRAERRAAARDEWRGQQSFDRRQAEAAEPDFSAMPTRSAPQAAADAVPVERRIRRSGSMADRLGQIRRARNGDAVVTAPDPTAPTRIETRHSGSDRRWSSHWRNDRRYDWRRHRDRHRSTFRFGHYWDPYGYNYRRFSIGFNIRPNYYRSSYWLNDPWMYRLPPAYGPYRWVRYWDDALLVNVYTGQVVDVVYDFFW